MSEKHLRLESDDAPKVDALDREAKLLELIERLATQANQSGLSASQLETILTRVGISTAEGMRQTLRPENADHPHISAYFTEGDRALYGSYENKPKLRRKTFFVGAEERDERLTPAEIDEYNKIADYRTARGGKWTAEIRKQGDNTETLHITVPCETIDQRMELPSLLLILMELNGHPSTSNLHGLVRQIEMLKGLVIQAGTRTPTQLETELLAQA